MCNPFRYAAVFVAALLAAAYVAVSSENGPNLFRAFVFEPASAADTTTAAVNRARKSDRLTAVRRNGNGNAVIATVEIVGLRDAALVYRARDGRVLFRTDPLANATIVAKDVALPEVTIRDVQHLAPQRLPVTVVPVPATPNAPPVDDTHRAKVLEGCDPAFSPLTAPARDNFASRCLAALVSPTRIAAALP